MAIYFSASKVAFYNTDIFSVDDMPSDKVEVTAERYKELMIQQNNGAVIVADASGNPTTMSQTCGACDCLVHEKTVASASTLGHVKIDSTPKSGSNNAVTSGGVYAELAKTSTDSAVLHKAGDEVITGTKTIQQDTPKLNLKLNSSTGAGGVQFVKSDGTVEASLAFINSSAEKSIDISVGGGSVEVIKPSTGSAYATAPATNESVGKSIATVEWANSKLSGKANTSHSHAISDVTNLQTTLNGKANTSHSHTIANVTGLQAQLNKGFQNTCVEISNGTDISAYKFVAILNNDGFVSFAPTCLVIATGKICNWISDDWGEFNAGSYSYNKSNHEFSGSNGGGITKIYGIN